MSALNSKLFALASKATNRKFSVRRETEEGITFQLRMDGFPESLTTGSVADLASTNGAKLTLRGEVGEMSGSGNGAMAGSLAREMVQAMSGEEVEATPRKPRNRLKEGEHNPAEVNGTV